MLVKKYLKNKPYCKVTFYFPSELSKTAVLAENVYLAGDFNDWDETITEMKRLKDGRFTVTLELERGHEYEFRYWINGVEWHNDWEADKYTANPFFGDNSVVIVE